MQYLNNLIAFLLPALSVIRLSVVEDNGDMFAGDENPDNTEEEFDFEKFIGSNPLEIGTQEMELLGVKDKPSEIRLTFKKDGHEGIATEMFSKKSTDQGWVIGKWLKVFNITKPERMNKKDSLAHVIAGIKDCIGEKFSVNVTKAPVGDSLYNAVTEVPNQ